MATQKREAVYSAAQKLVICGQDQSSKGIGASWHVGMERLYQELVSVAQLEDDAVIPVGPVLKSNDLPNDSSEAAVSDPIITALQQRASDLGMSIINPNTLSKKLRESLQEIAGDKSVLYHISARYDKDDISGSSAGSIGDGNIRGNIKFQIARMSPNFVARIIADKQSAELQLSARRNINGWELAVGVQAWVASFGAPPKLSPDQSDLSVSFSVTLAR